MKNLNNYITERLRINKNMSVKDNTYYALLGNDYRGYDYLVNNLGDTMITGDNGSGINIFIVQYKVLITLDKKLFDDKFITIWNISEKYQDNIDKFETDFQNGTINLDNNCIKLFNDDELDEILKNFK